MTTKKVWTTREGKKIPISKMPDKHLINAIRMLDRIAEMAQWKALSDGYALLGMLQGEMAIDSVENDLRRIEDYGIDPNEISPLYDDLCTEALDRGLDIYDVDFQRQESQFL